MTLQFLILTGMIAAQSRELGIYANPFYGADEEYVRDNLVEASKIYKDLLPGFISSYVISKAFEHGIIPDKSLSTVIKYEKRTLQAIQNHEIEPIPMYEQLQNFVM